MQKEGAVKSLYPPEKGELEKRWTQFFLGKIELIWSFMGLTHDYYVKMGAEIFKVWKGGSG